MRSTPANPLITQQTPLLPTPHPKGFEEELPQPVRPRGPVWVAMFVMGLLLTPALLQQSLLTAAAVSTASTGPSSRQRAPLLLWITKPSAAAATWRLIAGAQRYNRHQYNHNHNQQQRLANQQTASAGSGGDDASAAWKISYSSSADDCCSDAGYLAGCHWSLQRLPDTCPAA